MAGVQNEFYVGKGTAYLEKIGSDDGLIPIGNATSLALAFATSEIEMTDYENAGGGVADSITRIDGVTASATIANLNTANLAKATAGVSEAVESTAVAQEAHTVGVVGSLVKFNKVPDTEETITVSSVPEELEEWEKETDYQLGDKIKNDGKWYEVSVAGKSGSDLPSFNHASEDDTTTDGTVTWKYKGALPSAIIYADGEDYEVRNGGIVILDGAISKGDTIHVAYSSISYDVIEALTSVGAEYRFVFDGLNEANSGKPFLITAHRVQVSPTAGLPLIADEYATIDVELKFLKDEKISGSNKSKYVKIEKASK